MSAMRVITVRGRITPSCSAHMLTIDRFTREICEPSISSMIGRNSPESGDTGEQRRSIRFQAAACLRPDCDHPGAAEDTDEYFVERIIGRRPYEAMYDANVAQPTEFMWLVKWDGYVNGLSWRSYWARTDGSRHTVDIRRTRRLGRRTNISASVAVSSRSSSRPPRSRARISTNMTRWSC